MNIVYHNDMIYYNKKEQAEDEGFGHRYFLAVAPKIPRPVKKWISHSFTACFFSLGLSNEDLPHLTAFRISSSLKI